MSCDVGGALDLERAVSFELSNDSFITLVTAARSSCEQQAAELQSVAQFKQRHTGSGIITHNIT